MNRSIVFYTTPYTYVEFADACGNLGLAGFSVMEVFYSVLAGIHSNNPCHFYHTWMISHKYDFECSWNIDGTSVHSWEQFMHHYYHVIDRIMRLYVPSFNIIPSQTLITQCDFDKFVVEYVL